MEFAMQINFSNLKTTLESVLTTVPANTPPLEGLVVIPIFRTPTGAQAQATGFLSSGEPTRLKLVILDTYLKAAAEITTELLQQVPPEQSRIVQG